MAFLGQCPPCQHGDHDHHYEVIQVAPEGMLGGGFCMCKGECRDNFDAIQAGINAISKHGEALRRLAS